MRIVKLLIVVCLLIGCNDESITNNNGNVVNKGGQVEQNKAVNDDSSEIKNLRFEGVDVINKFNNISSNNIISLENSYIVKFNENDKIFNSLDMDGFRYMYHLTMDSGITSLESIARYDGYGLCTNDKGIYFYDMEGMSNNNRIIHLDKYSLKEKNIYNIENEVWGLSCTQKELFFMTGDRFALKSLKAMDIESGKIEVLLDDEIVIDYQVTIDGIYCLINKDEVFQLILITDGVSEPVQLYEFKSEPIRIYSLLDSKLLIQLSDSLFLNSTYVILNDQFTSTEVISNKSITFVGYDNNNLFFIEQTSADLDTPNTVHVYSVNKQEMELYDDNVMSIQFSSSKYFVRKYYSKIENGEFEFETLILDELNY